VFQNVRIFDGKSGELSQPASVLVRGNKIERISATAIPADQLTGAVLIDGGGRTLMPGLIDMHWHAMLVRPTPAAALANDVGYSNLVAAAEATDTLLRGFTTVRDLGGPTFGLKRAIDEGLVAGPRIFPSGAVITVTGGSRGLSTAARAAADRGRAADPDGSARRQHGRRQSRRGSPANQGAADARARRRSS
jgi:imidazolonepropionase-like amidohydrolase